MKIIFKKLLVVLAAIIACLNFRPIYVNAQTINASVLLYDETDEYINALENDLKETAIKYDNKITFTFYNSQNNQQVQNKQLETCLKDKTDIILLNLVDVFSADSVINKIKNYNIPVLLFNREPVTLDGIKSYGRAVYIGTDAKQAGKLQGEVVATLWNRNRKSIDKNDDDILQYVLLKGEKGNLETDNRSYYSIKTINDSNIKTQGLANIYCNWNKKLAEESVTSLLYRYGDDIEAIICNNDAMAEGAVASLQSNGYNMTNNSKQIMVVGIDGSKEALALIDKNYMDGTVVQNLSEMADLMFKVSLNLIENKNPVDGTNYKLDETNVCIRVPYTGVKISQ